MLVIYERPKFSLPGPNLYPVLLGHISCRNFVREEFRNGEKCTGRVLGRALESRYPGIRNRPSQGPAFEYMAFTFALTRSIEATDDILSAGMPSARGAR